MSPELLRRVRRFAVAGLLITAVDFAAFRGLLVTGLDPTYARPVAFVAAFAFSFLLHRAWTFGSDRSWGVDFLKYLPARLVGFLLAYLTFLVAHDGFGLHPDLAFLLQAPVQPVANFFLAHRWVFPARQT
jgi:putative flippase GtrA